MKSTLTEHLHSSQLCFGTWEIGVEQDLKNALFQSDSNDLFHTSNMSLMRITRRLTRTSYNTTTNYFINVIKNFGGHLFTNCEAGSLYPHRARLEEAKLTTCFNDYHDLMVAARIGKEGYVRQIAGYCEKEDDTRVRQVSWASFEVYWGMTKDHKDHDASEIVNLTRSRMRMTRVCIYHVGQKYASESSGIVGECLAIMAFECARYQVDMIAGAGNKAAYFTTPKSPGVPTYEHSLLQYWINKMMAVATQAQRKNLDRNCPPIRVNQSNISFLAVIVNLIFLQHIWMALQQQHTTKN